MGWLDGEVALITGGGSGIGRAVVERYVEEGARVCVTDVVGERVEELKSRFGDRVTGLVADATTLEGNRSARAHVIKPPTDDKTVQVGSLVTVRYEDGTEETLAVVGPWEASGSNAAVASTSAFGRALLGKRPGDTASASVDKDSITVQIADVTLPAAATDAVQTGAE